RMYCSTRTVVAPAANAVALITPSLLRNRISDMIIHAGPPRAQPMISGSKLSTKLAIEIQGDRNESPNRESRLSLSSSGPVHESGGIIARFASIGLMFCRRRAGGAPQFCELDAHLG